MSKVLLLLVSGDVFSAVLVHYLGLKYLHGLSFEQGDGVFVLFLRIAVIAMVLILIAFLTELYDTRKSEDRTFVPIRVAITLTLSFAVLSAIYALTPQLMLDQSVMITLLVAFGFIQWLWHLYCPSLLKISGLTKKVLILGVGPMASNMEKMMKESKHNYVLAGYVQPAGELAAVPSTQILAPLEGLLEAAIREKVQKIVISLSERRGILPVRELLQARFRGIEVVDAASFHEELTGTLLVKNINPGWFIYSGGFCLNTFRRMLKRLADIGLSILGLLIVAPVLPLIVLAIKLDSPGPVLLRQTRLGEGEREFCLYKFRTMCQGAERQTGAIWAQKNDPRVTRLGKYLRKARLDEIPQLFNVLKGDMAFVGPRPERPVFVEQLKKEIPYYSKRHTMKPGVTGWAQVRYPYGASVEDAHEKLKYDLYYIKRFSLLLDFLIILETIKVVLCGRGGR